MTPHQITPAREMQGQAARAYYVRGKQGMTERISNIEQGIMNAEVKRCGR